jgi:hypothetical protein
MGNVDQTEANNFLKASLALSGGATYTATVGPTKLRLMNSTGSTPTATVTGTEVTGGSYVALGQNLTTAMPATPTAGSVTNTGAINYTGMPAVTVSAVEVWDSAATPVRKWFGTIVSKTTNAGDTLSFAASSITISES